jgi:hypothetical protein
MMWVAAARATYKGDKNEETAEDPGEGWSKVIPRALALYGVVDICSALVLILTRNYVCDTPLRTWLVGSIMLGSPTSLLIKGIGWFLKPRYKFYKLRVQNCRKTGEQDFAIEEVQMYDEFGREIHGAGASQQKLGNVQDIQCTYPRCIGSYRILSGYVSSDNDPVSWQLVGSNNGTRWRLIDEVEDGQVPLARRAPSPMLTELVSMMEDASFRQAFLAELIASGGSLAWLTLGSGWIAMSSESCVDSAPELWYYCFMMAVTTWSCLGTVTIGLIVSAVAMIALGVKTP